MTRLLFPCFLRSWAEFLKSDKTQRNALPLQYMLRASLSWRPGAVPQDRHATESTAILEVLPSAGDRISSRALPATTSHDAIHGRVSDLTTGGGGVRSCTSLDPNQDTRRDNASPLGGMGDTNHRIHYMRTGALLHAAECASRIINRGAGVAAGICIRSAARGRHTAGFFPLNRRRPKQWFSGVPQTNCNGSPIPD